MKREEVSASLHVNHCNKRKGKEYEYRRTRESSASASFQDIHVELETKGSSTQRPIKLAAVSVQKPHSKSTIRRKMHRTIQLGVVKIDQSTFGNLFIPLLIRIWNAGIVVQKQTFPVFMSATLQLQQIHPLKRQLTQLLSFKNKQQSNNPLSLSMHRVNEIVTT